MIDRGVHLIMASTPRIPEACVNPRAKNFHWADMTKSLFEAQDKGADNPVLLDMDGNVTEGPGFNVFAVTNGVVATPDRGVLEGITRLSVIQMCEKLGIRCEVRTVPVDELRNADEVFISSTAGGVMGVTRLDDGSSAMIGRDRRRRSCTTRIGGSAAKDGAARRSTMSARRPRNSGGDG